MGVHLGVIGLHPLHSSMCIFALLMGFFKKQGLFTSYNFQQVCKRFLCILFLCCDFLVSLARVWQSLFATNEISCVVQALIFSRLIFWKFTNFLERFLCSKLCLRGSPNVCNISKVAQAPIFARFMKFLAISINFYQFLASKCVCSPTFEILCVAQASIFSRPISRFV